MKERERERKKDREIERERGREKERKRERFFAHTTPIIDNFQVTSQKQFLPCED